MSEFNSTVESALLEAIDFMGESVTIGNRTVQGIVNEVAFSEEYQDGGMLKQRGLTIVISRINPLPVIGAKVIYKGRFFRILELNDDAAGIEIICETSAK